MCTELPDIFTNKQWLINEPNKIVDDALAGLVRCNSQLALLDFGRVVVRRNHLSMEKVKIISGGASGHEPSFAGFVGQGMLTASVQGSIYSSPTPNLVIQTIKELARRHEKGILVIIGNNISDRLSFGLAVERARNIPNVKIRILQVADDCNKSYERRDLTGTLLIQKIAGAMAEADLFLYEIYLFCKALLDNISTVLVSLKPAISPLYEVSVCSRTITKGMEFGSGMHGQAGYLESQLLTAHETVQLLLQHITDPSMIGSITLDPIIPVVLLINNLGNSNKMEELIFINETIMQLQTQNITIERIYCSSFLTSIEMCGFSLTVFKITNSDILTYLDAPCTAPFWQSFSGTVLHPETNITLNTAVPPTEMQLKPKRGPFVFDEIAKGIEQVLCFACGALISCEKQLNLIDSESGDADTGTNMKVFCVKISENLTKGKLHINWPFVLFEEISKLLETTSEGLMSCLYAIMFEAAAQIFISMKETDFLTLDHWVQCLEAACKALERYGKTTFGRNTMYDALYQSTETLKGAIQTGMNWLDAVGLMAVSAEDTAKKTRLATANHPDPGAHAVGIWMRAMFEALKLQNWPTNNQI